jgi:hypothetical protein
VNSPRPGIGQPRLTDAPEYPRIADGPFVGTECLNDACLRRARFAITALGKDTATTGRPYCAQHVTAAINAMAETYQLAVVVQEIPVLARYIKNSRRSTS